MGESGEEGVLVLAEKEMTTRCPMQLASEIRQYTPSTDQKSVEFLKYIAARKILEDRQDSIRTAGKRKVREGAGDGPFSEAADEADPE